MKGVCLHCGQYASAHALEALSLPLPSHTVPSHPPYPSPSFKATLSSLSSPLTNLFSLFFRLTPFFPSPVPLLLRRSPYPTSFFCFDPPSCLLLAPPPPAPFTDKLLPSLLSQEEKQFQPGSAADDLTEFSRCDWLLSGFVAGDLEKNA